MEAAHGGAKASEASMSSLHPPGGRAYADKFRQLSFNVGRNAQLRRQLLAGQVSGHDLVAMRDSELATDEMTRSRERMKGELQDARRADWREVNEDKINAIIGVTGGGMFRCNKCGSERTTNYQKQMRSSDEPMTVFIKCLKCGKKWSE